MAERGNFPSPSVSWGKNSLEDDKKLGKNTDELRSYLKSQGADRNPARDVKTPYIPLLKTSSNDSLKSANQNIIFNSNNDLDHNVFTSFFEKLGELITEQSTKSTSSGALNAPNFGKGNNYYKSRNKMQTTDYNNYNSTGDIESYGFRSPVPRNV